MATRTFDVIVIGAGPAGEVAAGRLADGGLDVALVEDRLVGGECSYWACMPSKALLRPYEALAEIERVPGAKEGLNGKGVDPVATLKRRDEVIHDLDDSAQLPWLEDRGIALVRGHGRLTGERTVAVGDDTLEATKAVVLAAGSTATMPPIEGLDAVDGVWGNREATTAKEIPDTLVVLGGGVVGVELSQAFQTLGCQVTLIEGERRLLPNQEEFACAQVTDALVSFGVDVRTSRLAAKITQDAAGAVTVTMDDDSTATGDKLLVALGRTPLSTDLGLDSVGLEPKGYVEVDERMRVPGTDWLYVVGDLNGRVLLTHMGKYQARIMADGILGKGADSQPHGADGPNAPQVVFTEPQVARVGHTLASAQEAGLTVEAYDTSTAGNAGASFVGRNAEGTTRWVVDTDRGVVVGSTITGPDVQEFLHAATIAVVGEVPLSRLRHAVPAFPTRSENWLQLLDKAGV